MSAAVGIAVLFALIRGFVRTKSNGIGRTNTIESDMSSLRVYMASLRKKLGTGDNKEQYIQTHVGIGYRMIKMENKDKLL